ncbi:MAG: UDP-N-acetylmuramate dehydrogenase [Candidatus Cryptobacteroides sp.]
MIEERHNFSLKAMNTFGMDVSCGVFIEYDNEEDLRRIDFNALDKPVFHIGRGSNVLFSGNFPGTVLHSAIKYLRTLPEDGPEYAGLDGDTVLIAAGSGVTMDSICCLAAENGFWGIENLSLIPGEIGAAAVQNIGAYGSEISQALHSVRCYDTEECRFIVLRPEECGYGYRDSFFKHCKGRFIITEVVLSLTKAFSPQLGYGNVRQTAEAMLAPGETLTPMKVREAVIGIRNGKLPDPADVGSAGSFFKNPVVDKAIFSSLADRLGEFPHYDLPDGNVKIPAGWLVEQCGWKGRTIGNAGVYPKQALVLTNATGKASPEEIIALKDLIIKSVVDRFGITLVPEVEII